MPAKQTAPYGSWKSLITTSLITQGGLRLGEVRIDGPHIYVLEGRPNEAGRSVIVRLEESGSRDITPQGFNARNRVHEYGGGAYAVHGGSVYFTNWTDQRIYRRSPGGEPEPITVEPSTRHGHRYADLQVSPDGAWLLCVRESHLKDKEVTNEVVAVPIAPAALTPSAPKPLAGGSDFFAFPRTSPNGKRICWTQWNHPNMPWDGCELWAADVDAGMRVSGAKKVAGGTSESIFQPAWSPDNELYFMSDRSGWWNPYAFFGGKTVPIAPMEEECGAAQWVFGMSTYAFLGGGTGMAKDSGAEYALAFAHQGPEGDRLGLVRRVQHRISIEAVQAGRSWHDLDLPYTSIGSVQASGRFVYFVGAGPSTAPEVVELDTRTGEHRVLRKSLTVPVDSRCFSVPEPITFATGPAGGDPALKRSPGPVAHALFYPPVNPDYSAPASETPPLIVISHGGPTSAAGSALSPSIQFWTSRGFGVVDVNYRGSTGYGRAYREALKGAWGIADVEDCVAAARYLAAQGKADGKRLIIRGGSAGGYTTLCALVFTDAFAAGASYYGVADAETLAKDTHKYESRYLDGLIGPYPAARQTYYERSPIHFVDRISCPVIIFQGLEDEVVPPSQAEAMVEALRARRLPFAYVPFEGEQHGFRKAENIARSLEAELYFYGRVFGFKPADAIEPVKIENL